jgi:hypothetical protein
VASLFIRIFKEIIMAKRILSKEKASQFLSKQELELSTGGACDASGNCCCNTASVAGASICDCKEINSPMPPIHYEKLTK